MVHPVSSDDFRALRYVLDPEDFALGSEYRDPPPFDLISREDWEHLVHLPDDVSIRTSSLQGSVLSGLMRLADAWRGLLEFERLQEPLFQMMLNAADDFDASVFSLLHGFYRQSATALRSALEQTVIGTDCQLLSRESELDAWRS